MRHGQVAEVGRWEEEAEVGEPAEGGGPGGALQVVPVTADSPTHSAA